jgi:hypothetical protein
MLLSDEDLMNTPCLTITLVAQNEGDRGDILVNQLNALKRSTSLEAFTGV